MSSKSNLKLKDYLSEDGKLDLSILNLKAVPNINDILALRKVKSIDLSNNQIESLPGCIPCIHTLDLSKNHLTKLPENFGQLKSLKQLDLFDNHITNLPISFCELTKLEYLDLKNNPLDDDLQTQAGKCLNKKECRLCATKVMQYIETRKAGYEKEQAIKLKKKQANEKAKAKKREKQAEKEREEKRLKRIENAQKRVVEMENQQNEINENEGEDNDNKDNAETKNDNEDQAEGLLSQVIDGALSGLLLSLMILLAWELYQNRQQSINWLDFYKYI
ncbi:unnamed protein product [Rotaria sp. Silwood1]|nr:unnamed protein product [Rotaria sp. Silwood1]CAF0770628.1 unnamed protein product [Rotaria sp. Silwood1]CAF3321488.1 unnamed protein product [Rotaria sp. Silwood1]CAF3337466.1 unnamed protein product [Rotaria sp. Silwood1]CAF4513536.1 unnamed protein product [Rotaria sp. Silwood1]